MPKLQLTLYVDENDFKRKSCASYIIIKCFQCTYTMGKYTSTVDNVNKKQGMKKFQAVENVYEGEQVFKYERIGHYLKWEIVCEDYLYDSNVHKKDGKMIKSKQIITLEWH